MILRDVLPKTNLKENSTNPSTIEDKTPPLVGLLIGVIITIAVLVLVLYCVWKKCVRRKRKRQRFNSRSPNAAIHKAIQQPRALKEMSRANESGKKHGVNAKILGSCGDLMAVREQASSSSIVASNDVQQEVLGSGKELTIASEVGLMVKTIVFNYQLDQQINYETIFDNLIGRGQVHNENWSGCNRWTPFIAR